MLLRPRKVIARARVILFRHQMAASRVLIPVSVWHKQGVSADRRPPKPLDPKMLENLALRYVERFATTEGKLVDYLTRKLRERGWAGRGRPTRAGWRRGWSRSAISTTGPMRRPRRPRSPGGAGSAPRGAGASRRAGRGGGSRSDRTPGRRGGASRRPGLARRRRIGPFGEGEVDRAVREKQLAAMLRAGHAMELSRRIVSAAPGEMSDDEEY